MDTPIDDKLGISRDKPDRLVLVHCSASSAGQWQSLRECLNSNYEVVPIELHGHGKRKRWDGHGPMSLASEASGITSAVEDYERPFHLIGHSYGGGVALRFALSHRQCLASLTLIEPSCFHVLKQAGPESYLLNEVREIADHVNEAVICGDYRAAMQVFIDYWCGDGEWASLSEERRQHLSGLAVHVAHHYWSLIQEKTPLASYRAIDVPTLLLCGTKSPKPSRAITRLLTEVMPNAVHRTIAHGNHMAAINQADRVNSIIRDFLQKIRIGKTGFKTEQTNGLSVQTDLDRHREGHSAGSLRGRDQAPLHQARAG